MSVVNWSRRNVDSLGYGKDARDDISSFAEVGEYELTWWNDDMTLSRRRVVRRVMYIFRSSCLVAVWTGFVSRLIW